MGCGRVSRPQWRLVPLLSLGVWFGVGCGGQSVSAAGPPSATVTVNENESIQGTPLRPEAWPVASSYEIVARLSDGDTDGAPFIGGTDGRPDEFVFALSTPDTEVAAVVIWSDAAGTVTVHTHRTVAPITAASWGRFEEGARRAGTADLQAASEPTTLVLPEPHLASYLWLTFESDADTSFREVSVLPGDQIERARRIGLQLTPLSAP